MSESNSTQVHPRRAAILAQAELQEIENLVLLDELDEAILGLVRLPDNKVVLAYSTKLILDCLSKDGMTRDEAMEHFEYNIEGAYAGPGTPVYVQDELRL